jgi:hypothetical protein
MAEPAPPRTSLSRTIATRQLEWRDTTGEYGAREGARLIRSEMEVGRPSEAPTRDRAVPLRRVWVWDQHDGRAPALPDVWEASVGANPEATLLRHAGEAVSPTMLWFDEAKDFGFILTEEGERISVHRGGFLPGQAPVGRCPRRAVRLTATVQNGKPLPSTCRWQRR